MSKIFFLFIAALFYCQNSAYALPLNFVYLKDVDPSIIQDMKYYSTDNFIGRRVKGYDKPTCILTYKTALALSKLQMQLKQKGLGIKVYDCYRPTMAVKDFMLWSQDVHDLRRKKEHYPLINKSDLFKLGYVAEKSGHSRGSTVDLTLVNYATGAEMNMGTHFDFMDESSHTLSQEISRQAMHNRLLLQTSMKKAGFNSLESEWWHFTLANEPFPNNYFNFPVS